MKKMIAMMLVGGVLAVCTVGCGPSGTTGTTTVTTDKTKVTTPKDSDVKVDKKDNGKSDVKVDAKDAPKDK